MFGRIAKLKARILVLENEKYELGVKNHNLELALAATDKAKTSAEMRLVNSPALVDHLARRVKLFSGRQCAIILACT